MHTPSVYRHLGLYSTETKQNFKFNKKVNTNFVENITQARLQDCMTPGKNGLADKFGMTTLWGRERSLIQKWEGPLISGLQENREKGELIRIWEGPVS